MPLHTLQAQLAELDQRIRARAPAWIAGRDRAAFLIRE